MQQRYLFFHAVGRRTELVDLLVDGVEPIENGQLVMLRVVQ